MTNAQYEALRQRLAEKPQALLEELCRRLAVRVDVAWQYDHQHVRYRPGSLFVGEALSGTCVTELYAQALALAVRRRLGAIERFASDIAAVDEAIECGRTSLELSRLLLGAILPARVPLENDSGALPPEPVELEPLAHDCPSPVEGETYELELVAVRDAKTGEALRVIPDDPPTIVDDRAKNAEFTAKFYGSFGSEKE